MANEYHLPIIVVEAAYNWAPREYTKKPAPFAESPEGQKEFWEEVNRAVTSSAPSSVQKTHFPRPGP